MNNNVFTGKNCSITWENAQFTLHHPVSEDEIFDTFDELAASHPICEQAREFFCGREEPRNEAMKFMNEPNQFRDANHLMESLDASELEKTQDWDNESTTWTFGDGSVIRVCRNDYDAFDSVADAVRIN